MRAARAATRHRSCCGSSRLLKTKTIQTKFSATRQCSCCCSSRLLITKTIQTEFSATHHRSCCGSSLLKTNYKDDSNEVFFYAATLLLLLVQPSHNKDDSNEVFCYAAKLTQCQLPSNSSTVRRHLAKTKTIFITQCNATSSKRSIDRIGTVLCTNPLDRQLNRWR